MPDNTAVEENDEELKHMTVGELIEHLKKFDQNEQVIILAQVPFDEDDPDNAGKTQEELEEESTLELPILGIDHIEYDDTSKKSVGLVCDISEILEGDDSDEDDEELVDDGKD